MAHKKIAKKILLLLLTTILLAGSPLGRLTGTETKAYAGNTINGCSYVQGLATKSNWTNLVVQLKNFDQSFSTRASVGDTATSLNESVRMAATTLSILPLLIMYLILQKQFVESIDRSGITGE